MTMAARYSCLGFVREIITASRCLLSWHLSRSQSVVGCRIAVLSAAILQTGTLMAVQLPSSMRKVMQSQLGDCRFPDVEALHVSVVVISAPLLCCLMPVPWARIPC